MAVCSICREDTNTPEREEMGYTHCASPSCVGTWRNRRIKDAGLVLVNLHKQGLMWVQMTEDVVTKNGRRT